MYVDKIQFNQIEGKPRMSVNAAHIEIRVGNVVVFTRSADVNNDGWWDETHRELVKALDEVERIVGRIIEKGIK